MSGERKLTDEKIAYARQQTQERRKALALARLYPTVAELAAELQCTPRYLQKVLAGKAR